MFSESVRLQRNQAEKLRRDKLNGYVTELSSIVPLVSEAGRRVDKTSVLRLSAAYLRLHKFFPGSRWRLECLDKPAFQAIMQSFSGFFILLDHAFKILVCSSTVQRFLGFQNIDLMGHSLSHFIHPEDHLQLLKHLKSCSRNPNCERFSIHCRVKDQDQSKAEGYQLALVRGFSYKTEAKDMIIILVQPIQLSTARPLLDNNLEEYITRHRMDGTIIFADQRISLITGHLPSEVSGLSAYKFILDSDVPIASFAHNLMFSNSEGTGVIVYRLQTRNNQFIYLHSFGYIQKKGDEVDHFVCVNRLLSTEKGEEVMENFSKKFLPFLGEKSIEAKEPEPTNECMVISSSSNESSLYSAWNQSNSSPQSLSPSEGTEQICPYATKDDLINDDFIPNDQISTHKMNSCWEPIPDQYMTRCDHPTIIADGQLLELISSESVDTFLRD